MGPAKTLDGDALRANAAAFAALGAPVAAVLKRDGYGWGAAHMARELEGSVESFVVADADEFEALRPATSRPIRLLAEVAPDRLPGILDAGGIPNVATPAGLAAAAAQGRRRGGATIRVGILDAALWSAVRPQDAAAFAQAAAGSGLRVELWTHIAAPSRAEEILGGLAAAQRAFAAAGVPVAGTDVAGTAAAAPATARERLRIGAGLFGVRLGAPVRLRCAIRVDAPVVRRFAAGTVAWAGYGERRVPPGSEAAVLRCGYGDGWPSTAAGRGAILAVGMQYTTVACGDGDPGALVGPATDLDALAAECGVEPHAFVVGLA